MLIFNFKGLRLMSVITEHCNIVNKNTVCVLVDSDLSKKVKVTLVQALRLCTGRMAHRGGVEV
jgi:hypothetical protein